MGASTNLTVSKKELVRLAIKPREDLIDYEDKLGSSREFAELMNSAGALVVAITEPADFLLSGLVNRNDSLDIA
jgi:hypothetical protein